MNVTKKRTQMRNTFDYAPSIHYINNLFIHTIVKY